MQRIHLICNAHLDPCWLWEWEEGAAAAIATFRTAADLCEEYDGFVFNHNEVILYQWIEEYEPALFSRIQRLVQEGKWHIMGGWFLQPDCNMPSGESFVRQALVGRHYFREKFGVVPTTAINFDPFGHTRGLAQILARAGYDSYLFCRPMQHDCELPADDFIWVGYDGSTVMCFRASAFYNAPLGKAREKIERYIAENPDKPLGMVLWGVGDHGGGPSRVDLDRIADLVEASHRERGIIHSSPERYFAEMRASGAVLPRHERDINPWGVGCYTSQIRIKQLHRRLENEYYLVEKMLSHAALARRLVYPQAELREALRDLLQAEFHDILPGSSIQPVEEAGLRLLDHGLEICSRLRARAFFALAAGELPSRENEYPILVYNPHPFPVRGVFECEFQLQDACFDPQFSVPTVYHNGQALPSQNEKELSNLTCDWRKRPVWYGELLPGQITRFDCRVQVLPERPKPPQLAENGAITVRSECLEVVVNCGTGLIDRLVVHGREFLKPGAVAPLVVDDYDDPWGMLRKEYRDVVGRFALMTPEAGTKFSGVTQGVLDSVRVIEDGPVRTVIEAVLEWGASFLVLTYKVPKIGTEMEVHVRVHWNEKSRMLKLSLPTRFPDGVCMGQVAYGRDILPDTGREIVAQKWIAVVSESDDSALTVINDGTYGADYTQGELRLNLLRSPAYSGHPIWDRPIVPQDRYTPRIDQGERQYRFWINAGPRSERLAAIDREALVHNERPYALSFNPPGQGEILPPLAVLSDDVVQLSAFKQGEAVNEFIIRLFEPTGQSRTTTLSLPLLGIEETVRLGAFEIRTLAVDPRTRRVRETGLMEM